MNQRSLIFLGLCLVLESDFALGLLDKLIKGGGSANCDCPCRDYWTVKCTMEYETKCKPTYTGQECTKVAKHVPVKVKETECQKCVKFFETILETKSKTECVTVYDEKCDTQYPAQCTTEQQCTMLYQTVCNTVHYAQKCSQVPKQKCIPVTKCHRIPQTNCKPVQRQKCGKVPVKVPKRVKKHSCSPYDPRDSSLSQTNCGPSDEGLSSGYGAPSSSYGAPSPSYGAPTGSLSPPSAGYNGPQLSSTFDAPQVGDFQSINLTPDTIQSAPDSYGSPLAPPQGNIDSYGSPQGSPISNQDSYGSPLRSVIGSRDSYGSPLNSASDTYGSPSIGSPDTYGSPSFGATDDSFGSPQGSSGQGAPDSYGSPVGATIVNAQAAPDSYGTPLGQAIGDAQSAPDSYGTPLGTPLNTLSGSFAAQDSYGSPVAAAPNVYVSPIVDSSDSFGSPGNSAQGSDSYGSPENQGQGSNFQIAPNSYGSPPSTLFQAPDNYGSPGGNQFQNNDQDVSLATIRVVDPPNSIGSNSNPFLGNNNNNGRNNDKPYQQSNLLEAQSQPVPALQSANRFVPEFIPSMRLPDNFEPNLDAMIIRTTERNSLLNKMKFPENDQDISDYTQTNNLLRGQNTQAPQSDDSKGTKTDTDVVDNSADVVYDEAEDDGEGEDEEDEDEEYEDDTEVEKNPVQVGVGKMGKAAPSPKPTTAAPPAAAVVENKKPERSQQLTKEPEVVDKSLNTDNDIDDKTLEKVLENILAEVEQTDSEEDGRRKKKKRRITGNPRSPGNSRNPRKPDNHRQTLYGTKLKRRKAKRN